MRLQRVSRLALVALSCAVFGNVQAGVAYDESKDGDFSNVGSKPTSVHTHLGSNLISGSTGSGPNGVDRDYFSITVPLGAQLSSLTVEPGTSVGGDVTFIALQAGADVTVSPDALSADGLLGWMHYGPGNVDRNILPRIGKGEGATGFTGPLGPGTYSFWVQDFNKASYDYNLVLTASSAPEPQMYFALLAGFVVLILRFRQAYNRAL